MKEFKVYYSIIFFLLIGNSFEHTQNQNYVQTEHLSHPLAIENLVPRVAQRTNVPHPELNPGQQSFGMESILRGQETRPQNQMEQLYETISEGSVEENQMLDFNNMDHNSQVNFSQTVY